jgi:hypothetical protein
MRAYEKQSSNLNEAKFQGEPKKREKLRRFEKQKRVFQLSSSKLWLMKGVMMILSVNLMTTY